MVHHHVMLNGSSHQVGYDSGYNWINPTHPASNQGSPTKRDEAPSRYPIVWAKKQSKQYSTKYPRLTKL